MASEFIIENNRNTVLRESEQAILRALEICGGMAESHAKDNLTAFPRVDTGNLRNHVTHQVSDAEQECVIGTAVDYAPYVEYGTGIYAEQGGRQTPWFYEDDKGKGHFTHGMKPSHFLKKAITEHQNEYIDVIKSELEDK